MIVSINQPAYLPWLGYFERIARSDVHVVLDHVQFEKNSYINRNKVRTSDGWTWLSVPVRTRGKFKDLAICDLQIDNMTNWRAKHWRTVCQNYGKAKFFDEHASFFEAVYKRDWESLVSLCEEINNYLLKVFQIETSLRKSSAMNPHGTKGEMLIDLCEKVKAETYISGALGRSYLSDEKFEKVGIGVEYQSYEHPLYNQSRKGEFEPHMGAIDLLFNYGPESRCIMLCE